MRGKMFAAAAALVLGLTGAQAAEAPEPEAQDWSFTGIFGTFDRPALQRGLQVYREVCAACHSIKYVAFRTLDALGYSQDEIKAIAAEYEVPAEPNEEGEIEMRPAKPFDLFPPPFPNEQAARAANNGALPPDLSLITKARKGGPDYVYSLLVGYEEEPPEGVELMDGMYYNKYFPGHQIAMPPPLSPDAVEYADGTEATVEQMAHDVVSFLAWTGSPEMETRKRLGIKVILFLIVLTAMLYAVKRKVWAKIEH